MIKTNLSTEECDLCGLKTEVANIDGDCILVYICEDCTDRLKKTFTKPRHVAVIAKTKNEESITSLQKQVDALKVMMKAVTDFQELELKS